MIRHVILIKFRPETTREQVDALIAAMHALEMPGLRDFSVGADLGLREGNMSYAGVFDFEDEDAWRAYDRDEEHNRIRRELVAPIAERIERCQIRLERT
jgi:hypothetical protein